MLCLILCYLLCNALLLHLTKWHFFFLFSLVYNVFGFFVRKFQDYSHIHIFTNRPLKVSIIKSCDQSALSTFVFRSHLFYDPLLYCSAFVVWLFRTRPGALLKLSRWSRVYLLDDNLTPERLRCGPRDRMTSSVRSDCSESHTNPMVTISGEFINTRRILILCPQLLCNNNVIWCKNRTT